MSGRGGYAKTVWIEKPLTLKADGLGAAEALEKGELSTAGYAIQVGLLAREIERGDWDFVDKILKAPTDEAGLRQYVRTLEWLAGGGKEKLDRVVDPMVEKYKEYI